MAALSLDFISRRLRNQKLARSELQTAREVVDWLGAVQAQDYAGAKWALALRAGGLTDAKIERAFDAGEILRTHVLRPTWHFVTPADIRWMLALTAPRVKAASASYDRKLELDGKLLARTQRAFERALRGGRNLTRTELSAVLQKAGIAASGQRLGHVMLHAELDAVVCSGPRRGKQSTYALFEERVPRARTLARDEALAELAKRFFRSHGPATAKDFGWWSGLAARDARAGIERVGRLQKETVDGLTFWSFPSRSTARGASLHLLPNYDEHFVAYKDGRGPVEGADPARVKAFDVFSHWLAIGGRFAGAWRRSAAGASVTLEVRPFRSLTRDEARALDAQVARFARFLDAPVALSVR
jgi:hypothetical protein